MMLVKNSDSQTSLPMAVSASSAGAKKVALSTGTPGKLSHALFSDCLPGCFFANWKAKVACDYIES